MLDEVTREKVEKIAREVINLARNKLLVNMRFLDMALSRLNVSSNPEATSCSAVDGKVYIYDPQHILTAYRVEENLPARNFLHSVFHCVFRHMFVNPNINRLYWDLACDIAVESVINDLGLPYLITLKSGKQQQFLDGFKEELKTPSAEKVYRFLIDKKLPEDKIKTLALLFKGDDHFLWYLSDEEKGKMGIDGYGNSGSSKAGIAYGSGDGDPDGESDGDADLSWGSIRIFLEQDWTKISERMAIDIASFGKRQGTEAGLLSQNLKEVNRERYNYEEFLKKFAVRGEIMKINPDEFDYNFYTYGLQLYENMPLIEPLEYKDVKRIRDFVIAIDTSGSVAGELVQKFVQKTYNILKSTESFFTRINLHIIQCDAAIQEDVKITSQQEFDDYLKTMKLHGFGGTDFRPVFSYVTAMIECGEFDNLKGMIYFTDGYGTFPLKKPDYDAAFVFVDDDATDVDVPPWAIKLVLRTDEI